MRAVRSQQIAASGAVFRQSIFCTSLMRMIKSLNLTSLVRTNIIRLRS
jgi:hypothetical protein